MMDGKKRHWRMYCETEAAYVYTDAPNAPTECPNDAGHTLRAGHNCAEYVCAAPPEVPAADFVNQPGGKNWRATIDEFGSVVTQELT